MGCRNTLGTCKKIGFPKQRPMVSGLRHQNNSLTQWPTHLVGVISLSMYSYSEIAHSLRVLLYMCDFTGPEEIRHQMGIDS